LLSISLGLLFPLGGPADNTCIEGKETGPAIRVIEFKERLPRHWMTLNGKSVFGSQLATDLRTRYRAVYQVNRDGVGGFLCVLIEGTYVTVSQYGSGAWFSFSAVAPTCWKCTPMASNLRLPSPGSGLRIGQTKAEVAATLRISIPSDFDAVTIRFTGREKRQGRDQLHHESLTIEFDQDKLIKFDVSDLREDA
jgi:hypothetical protein